MISGVRHFIWTCALGAIIVLLNVPGIIVAYDIIFKEKIDLQASYALIIVFIALLSIPVIFTLCEQAEKALNKKGRYIIKDNQFFCTWCGHTGEEPFCLRCGRALDPLN